MDPEKIALLELMGNIIPFKFLPMEEKKTLLSELFFITASPMQWIFRPGSQDREVFLLEEGQVEQIIEESSAVNPENVIRAGHYFGERAALLNQNRRYGVRAITPVRAWGLPGSSFLRLIRTYTIFAQAFGSILRDKHGIFQPLERFSTEILRGLNTGFLPLSKLVGLYKELEPVLHPHAAEKDKLNLSALSYAIRRLPANVSTTFAWFLTDDLPSNFRDPDSYFPQVPSEARRRNIWQVAQGKNMVLIRNGVSDLTDLISNLCLYSVEAQKLRTRLNDPAMLWYLRKQAEDPQGSESPESLGQNLPFSPSEWDALVQLWGDQTARRLYELVLHHEDFLLMVERQLNNYNNRRSEKWALEISRATKTLCLFDPCELPPEWEVHIISSNTHSVTNCLSPIWHSREEMVTRWAESVDHPALKEVWRVPEDRLYALLPAFLKAYPEMTPGAESEVDHGILRLTDTSATGIKVQLIDTSRLWGHILDPGIPAPGRKPRLIVNIDYAFGEQADEIIRNLIMLFHRNIRSISILGKAGGLVGKRGDVLVPTSVIQQSTDQFLPLGEPDPRSLDRLRALLGKEAVHTGPILTVEGTLLQNAALLNFYRNIWNCQGLEMEGFYYARQIQQSMLLDCLGHKTRLNFFYYVSDIPLTTGENLSVPLSPSEGIPPLYAITREVLTQILQS